MQKLAAILLAALFGGCDMATDLLPPAVPPGGRLLIVTVENHSPRPATLVVAADNSGPIQAVGTANPNSVPAVSSVEVRFVIPAGSGWAIFVNPGPDRGPLVTASDIPQNATGEMPFTIGISADGSPFAQVPGPAEPGWFGN